MIVTRSVRDKGLSYATEKESISSAVCRPTNDHSAIIMGMGRGTCMVLPIDAECAEQPTFSIFGRKMRPSVVTQTTPYNPQLRRCDCCVCRQFQDVGESFALPKSGGAVSSEKSACRYSGSEASVFRCDDVVRVSVAGSFPGRRVTHVSTGHR